MFLEGVCSELKSVSLAQGQIQQTGHSQGNLVRSSNGILSDGSLDPEQPFLEKDAGKQRSGLSRRRQRSSLRRPRQVSASVISVGDMLGQNLNRRHRLRYRNDNDQLLELLKVIANTSNMNCCDDSSNGRWAYFPLE